MKYRIYEDSPFARFLLNDTRTAVVWFLIRLYVGSVWIEAALQKIGNPAWTGSSSGAALKGFVMGALAKTSGAHPDVSSWYAWFLTHVVLPHASLWAHIVSWGELLVGGALIVGALTGIAAFFGLFMNLNFLLAGTVSVNPILFVCSIALMLAWKVAGYWGVDRFLLPRLGTPWQPGEYFKRT